MKKIQVRHAKAKHRMRIAVFSSILIGLFIFTAYMIPDPQYAVRVISEEISDMMRVSEVDVEEEGASNLSTLVSREQVVRASAVQSGEETLRIDLGHVSKAVSQIPWVRAVRVAKRLPSRILIKYTVHDARAIAVRGREPWLVSASGEWIAPLKRIHERRRNEMAAEPISVSGVDKRYNAAVLDLPVILPGTSIDTALNIIDSYEKDVSSRVIAVHQVRSDKSGNVEAVVEISYATMTSRVILRSWATPSQESLERLKKVIDYLVKNNITIVSIDLRPGKKVVVSLSKES